VLVVAVVVVRRGGVGGTAVTVGSVVNKVTLLKLERSGQKTVLQPNG
jgi:hypothetical protein